MNDVDYVAANNQIEAINFYKTVDVDYAQSIEEPYPVELRDRDLTELKLFDEDAEAPENLKTFKEELEENLKDGTIFPCLFAAGET